MIDFDAIAVELGSPHPWDHPRPVAQAAATEFDRRVAAATGPVVVIRSAPTAQERADLASAINADEVRVLTVSASEAKARAERDGRPDWTDGAIDRWWAHYRLQDHPERNAPGTNPKHGSTTMSTPTTTPTPADVAAQQQPTNNGQPTGTTNPESTEPATPARLPDDHPLVTAYAAQKDEIAGLRQQGTDATTRAEQAEAEVAAIPAKVASQLREHLAKVHGFSDEDRDLFLTSDSPDTLLRQVQGLVARQGTGSGYVPTQGTARQAQVSPYELGAERGRARYKTNQN